MLIYMNMEGTGASDAPGALDDFDAPRDDILIELTNATFSYGSVSEPREATYKGEAGQNGYDARTGGADQINCAGFDRTKRSGGADQTDYAGSDHSERPGGADRRETGTTDVYDRDNAVEDISLRIRRGEFIVLIGRNGSGKSTIAKLLNALIIPDAGTVTVKGMTTSDPDSVWEIRRTSGMVFQNPDNQIVGTTVEEDVAFGVENLGTPPAEIRIRIDETMKATGVTEYSSRPPYQLSGGQKQRVAIAGILAMRPECIILDEATSMLDPDGRKEVLNLVRKLNKTENIAVVLITHHMDEAAFADRVYVVDGGRVIMSDAPRKIFGDADTIRSIGLDVPQITELFELLRKKGFADLPSGVSEIDEAYGILESMLSGLP